MVPVWHPDVKDHNPKESADKYGQLSTSDDILNSHGEHVPTRHSTFQPAIPCLNHESKQQYEQCLGQNPS